MDITAPILGRLHCRAKDKDGIMCRYEWYPRNPMNKPKECPRCKNRNWDKEA